MRITGVQYVWTFTTGHPWSPLACTLLLLLLGALAAVEFRGGAGLWPSGTSRTQQGGRSQEFFNHPVSVPLSLSFLRLLSLFMPCCFPLRRSLFLSLPLLLLHPVIQNAGKLWRELRVHAVHTHRQARKHESGTIKSTEAAETAGGGLWPHWPVE